MMIICIYFCLLPLKRKKDPMARIKTNNENEQQKTGTKSEKTNANWTNENRMNRMQQQQQKPQPKQKAKKQRWLFKLWRLYIYYYYNHFWSLILDSRCLSCSVAISYWYIYIYYKEDLIRKEDKLLKLRPSFIFLFVWLTWCADVCADELSRHSTHAPDQHSHLIPFIIISSIKTQTSPY